MKCKTFIGDWQEAQDAFNKWAEGKALMREVIIQTHTYYNFEKSLNVQMAIVVIHPDGAIWDSTKSNPIPRVQPEANKSTGLEHKDDRILLAPIHEEPEPHIKLEEVQVTQ